MEKTYLNRTVNPERPVLKIKPTEVSKDKDWEWDNACISYMFLKLQFLEDIGLFHHTAIKK